MIWDQRVKNHWCLQRNKHYVKDTLSKKCSKSRKSKHLLARPSGARKHSFTLLRPPGWLCHSAEISNPCFINTTSLSTKSDINVKNVHIFKWSDTLLCPPPTPPPWASNFHCFSRRAADLLAPAAHLPAFDAASQFLLLGATASFKKKKIHVMTQWLCDELAFQTAIWCHSCQRFT